MPVAYLKPSGEETGEFGNWVLSVMENDNFIFEVDNAEAALQKKERVIEELNEACIARLQIIEKMKSEFADKSKKEHNLRFQLAKSFRELFRR